MHDTHTGAARAVLRAPFGRRAWAEFAYCLVGFPVAVLGFVLVLVVLALSAVLAASLRGGGLGLLVVVSCTGLGRACVAVYRGRAAGLLGERVAVPPARRPTGKALARREER